MEETKNKQAKKYPKPEEQEAIDKIVDLANQWCEMESGERGVMVMLSHNEGTHYVFVGNQEKNTRAAIDILTADDMVGAGRAVQIAFLKAMLFIKFDNAQQKAGLNIWDIEDYAERRAAARKLPEYMDMVEKTRKLNEELAKIWLEK